MQHLRSGRLIGLGVSSATRDPALPDVPSIAESGVAGYEFYDWQGVVAPSKTPAVAITRLNQEFVKTLGPRSLHPAPQGTIFRISIVPPETDEILNLDASKAQEVFKGVGNADASTLRRGARHPLMHCTETMDYAVVLEGEITMLLDDSEVHLKAGDVVIQRGTNHAWSNRSGKPVRMLYVLMDARFDPELKQVL